MITYRQSPAMVAATMVKANGTERERATLAYLQAYGRSAAVLTLAATVSARMPAGLSLVA